jgi:hypothetical protein
VPKIIRRPVTPVAVVVAAVAVAVVASAGAEPADPFLSGEAFCPVPTPTSLSSRGEVDMVSVEVDDTKGPDLTSMRWIGVPVDPVSPEYPIEVRNGVVGLTIRAETGGWGDGVSVELLDPEGRLIACHDCPEDAPAVGEVTPGRGTTQVPSTDRPGWELTPGLYSFRVRAVPEEGRALDAGPITANVIATFRTNVAVEVEHLVDLNFIYLPECGLSPAVVDTSVHFQQFLDQIDVWMEPIGIRLGRVTHTSLDRPEFSVVASWREAGRMFRTSAEVGRQRTLNVYCYDSAAGEITGAVGFSGAIPGPAANGLRDSGIALKTSPFMTCVPPNDKGYSCLDAYASLFAHEIGHYVGFYHTTEGDLEDEDPLSDTPRCWEADLRACPDYDYVMFPLIHLNNSIWSPQQSLIAKTHPIIRTVAVVGPQAERPAGFASSPNPFRESVAVRAVAPFTSEWLRATVYDVLGRRVRKLAPGVESVSWDGADERGRPVPAGVYFVRAIQAGRVENLRVVKLR